MRQAAASISRHSQGQHPGLHRQRAILYAAQPITQGVGESMFHGWPEVAAKSPPQSTRSAGVLEIDRRLQPRGLVGTAETNRCGGAPEESSATRTRSAGVMESHRCWESTLMPLYPPLEFRGQHLEFLHDTTLEIDLEGALSSGKTCAALWKELEMLRRHAGIWSLIARYTGDSVETLLRPQFEQLARIHNTTLQWNAKESCYETLNGSRCYAFGLKTQSSKAEDRYARIRGLPVSRIYIDQAEALPADIALELRARLRPDIEARVQGKSFPRQLTFTPNPTNFDHWLAKQFPATNAIKNRRYYALSLYDNAHNLPADMIDSMLQTYPIEHPKHQTMILGQRGMNVIGDPVYENLFDRARHVRSITPSPDQVLLEAFQIGRHNPVWLVAQRTYGGAVTLLGGVLGQHAPLEDFLPVVALKRRAWFPPESFRFKTCTSPM